MSFHAAQTFTFGEQPSATKWQYIWDNDYALADGSGISSGAITAAKIAANVIDQSKIDWAAGNIWWQELGRTNLGAQGDTITISSITARKYLMIICSLYATGGTVNAFVRFNNDSGANYSRRSSDNGGADSTTVSQTGIASDAGTIAVGTLILMHVYNVAAQEKIATIAAMNQGTAGAANAPNRTERAGKWANTSSAITRVDVVNTAGTGDYAAGSEVVVLGHD